MVRPAWIISKTTVDYFREDSLFKYIIKTLDCDKDFFSKQIDSDVHGMHMINEWRESERKKDQRKKTKKEKGQRKELQNNNHSDIMICSSCLKFVQIQLLNMSASNFDIDVLPIVRAK